MAIKPLDAAIKAQIAAIKAAELDLDEEGDELTEEQEKISSRVTSTLISMGLSERILRRALVAKQDVDLPEIDTDQISSEDLSDLDEDELEQVTAGTLRVLAELGYDIDEDVAAGKVCGDDMSDDEDEALDEVTAKIGQFLVIHAASADALVARLKASINSAKNIAGRRR